MEGCEKCCEPLGIGVLVMTGLIGSASAQTTQAARTPDDIASTRGMSLLADYAPDVSSETTDADGHTINASLLDVIHNYINITAATRISSPSALHSPPRETSTSSSFRVKYTYAAFNLDAG